MKSKWILIVALFIGIGFFQEWVKVNVNFTLDKSSEVENFFEKSAEERIIQIEKLKSNNPFDYYESHNSLEFLQYFSRYQLQVFKWVVTFVFVIVFFFLNRKALSWLIVDDRMNRWLLSTYVISFLTAFFIYGLGHVFGSMDLFYNISRKMVGALQSPVPAMMNWAAWQLYIQQSKQ
jgi:hypothetical protein